MVMLLMGSVKNLTSNTQEQLLADNSLNLSTALVPTSEPSTMLLLVSGLAG